MYTKEQLSIHEYFRKQLEQMSASSAAGRLKAKGDALFARGKYYSALRIYNQIQA